MIGVVACAAGGVEDLRVGLVEPLVASGHQVGVTLTPTAGRWLDHLDEIAKLEVATGLPVRVDPRLPGEPRPHPKADAYVVAPASANTVAKLALGIGDNQALTVLSESLGTVPMLVFPRINAAHARHPAWQSHLTTLQTAGAQLLYGDHIWPLQEPRSEDPRQLPWAPILQATQQLVG